jgi:CRISPR-associated protein Cas2
MSHRRAWLIGYDIASPRRLRRVARVLEREAIRLQYSLFLGAWTSVGFERMWTKVTGLINPRADDVRAWPVPDRPWVSAMGMQWPAGIVLGGSHGGGMGSFVSRLTQNDEPKEAVRVEDSSADATESCDAGSKLFDNSEIFE